MAELKSTQITNATATPIVPVNSHDSGARVHREYFDFTVPVGDAAINDTVLLAKVPNGARLLGGKIVAEAMTTGAGAASIQIGDGTTAAKYLGTTSIDAAAEAEFGHTAALNFGELQTAELTLTATVVTEAWAAGQVLSGWVDYLLT
jgi:hypothetical protein